MDANRALEQIFSCLNQLVTEKDYDNTMRILTELGRTLVNSDRASFWVKDTKKHEYWTVVASGVSKLVIPEGKGIVGASIEGSKTIVINNPYEDDRFNPEVDKTTGYVTKSILCVPVINEMGDVIGAYQAINKLDMIDGRVQDSKFDEEDVRLIGLVTMLGGKTLESHILYMESHLDQLTGLFNRRGLIENFEKIIKSNEIFSIIMCDIDHFKKVNDTYGHNAGDAVLISVADRLVENVGRKGKVYRWGGEEFVILLDNVDKDEAVVLAESIREQVERSICKYENYEIRCTMSFGVTPGMELLPLMDNIAKADACLYYAKSTGRNRVIADR